MKNPAGKEAVVSKQSNPKDAVGSSKAPLSTLPWRVLWWVGLAMMEGALKYGRHNYRGAGVRSSVYFDALQRHVGAWWEGQDIDEESGLHHLVKAIACLMVIYDSYLEGNLEDDRPPATVVDTAALNERAKDLVARLGHIQPKHYTIKDKK